MEYLKTNGFVSSSYYYLLRIKVDEQFTALIASLADTESITDFLFMNFTVLNT